MNAFPPPVQVPPASSPTLPQVPPSGAGVSVPSAGTPALIQAARLLAEIVGSAYDAAGNPYAASSRVRKAIAVVLMAEAKERARVYEQGKRMGCHVRQPPVVTEFPEGTGAEFEGTPIR